MEGGLRRAIIAIITILTTRSIPCSTLPPPNKLYSKKEEGAERSHEEIANAKSRHDCKQFYSLRRRTTSDLHGSVCMSSISCPYEKKRQERKNILAMIYLRPNI